MTEPMRSLKKMINGVDFVGKSFISINDLSDEQLLKLFAVSKELELFNRGQINIFPDRQLVLLFFQPSTRTRMSFQTAMHRLGGSVISEANPKVTSSTAKEESLEDTMRCVSEYADIITLRHYDDVAAREAVKYATSPVINGGWGHWEHPTQALLDLYTLWRKFGRIEGLKVTIAAADLIEARTGHSMAYGLARLGADVTLASPKESKVPEEVTQRIRKEFGLTIREEFDLNKKTFNELIKDQDLVYLPGCSAPAGATAEHFKQIMDDYFVQYETLQEQEEKGHRIYVTHTLPRRKGEMDLRIDNTPHQLYFEAILHSVSVRMGLLSIMLGA
ncbi:MAG: aspartate carbamoyltransferase [Actinomycetaceae bacterium]|nr:aspartate carbamoyltransferase [Actinomycetaceae bacterium]